MGTDSLFRRRRLGRNNRIQRRKRSQSPFFSNLLVLLFAGLPVFAQLEFLNGNKPVVDAHNCYPYNGQWADRLSRALGSGYPKGIEQDLAWSAGRVVLSHSAKTTGSEPTLREHFFEAVRPLIEKALADNNGAKWPMIVLHFDVKDNRPELLHAVWDLLGEYENWIVTAPKSADKNRLEAFSLKPILVLTEDSDAQEKVFYDEVRVGARLRVFGSAHTNKIPGETREERAHMAATLEPERLLSEHPTNYRRWWNNSWSEVEEGGQTKAGDWTAADNQRLRALVDHAHRLGFWIRFYTLDGFLEKDNRGWEAGYNFGSREAVEQRWKAALAAGVNLIATDQYEDLSALAAP
jgi:hypothetical protein